jgi:7,8-dihydropterin-6-yl-methyl-4-(beta-D-ribofuranosyl)aminobenzene 5'-phosphate synthase
MKKMILILLILSFNFSVKSQDKIEDFKVTILSTMLSDSYIGEWGFSALIEVDGSTILFDTGSRKNTVIQNANEMGITLNSIKNLFISHNHKDHTGGLKSLKKEFPSSFLKIHVGKGIFYPRSNNTNSKHYILENKEIIESLGSEFITHIKPKQIIPGIWTTGIVPRKFEERNWSGSGKLKNPVGEIIEDTIPEDQSLFFDTKKGIVLISGCGHAGLVNTLEHIKKIIPNRPIYKILGGFHLLKLNSEKLKWTANKMKEAGVKYFVGAHCTGINSTYKIRDFMNLSEDKGLVGSVGTYIDKNGIHTGYMQ